MAHKTKSRRQCLAFDHDFAAGGGRSFDAFERAARKKRVPLPRGYDDCRPLKTKAQVKAATALVRAFRESGFYLSRS